MRRMKEMSKFQAGMGGLRYLHRWVPRQIGK